MPNYIATIRDRSEKVLVWEETGTALYDTPVIKRNKDAVGRFWTIALRESCRTVARDRALMMVSKEKVRRGL